MTLPSSPAITAAARFHDPLGYVSVATRVTLLYIRILEVWRLSSTIRVVTTILFPLVGTHAISFVTAAINHIILSLLKNAS